MIDEMKMTYTDTETPEQVGHFDGARWARVNLPLDDFSIPLECELA